MDPLHLLPRVFVDVDDDAVVVVVAGSDVSL